MSASGPDRIFATVNGMSTRLPDGGRQFIGGWSQDSDRPHAIEYVRADLAAAAPDLLKALEGLLENASTIDGCDCEGCKKIDRARAALLKASGGGE